MLNNWKSKSPCGCLSVIPIYDYEGVICAYLRPLTVDYEILNPNIVRKITSWRNANKDSFFTSFHATDTGTKAWLNSILQDDSKMLFIIQDLHNRELGHMGYSNINREKKSGEIDAVIRGEQSGTPFIMTHSLKGLLKWGRSVLRLNDISLSVFKHNKRAIKLYERCGFKYANEIPLRKVEQDGVIYYEEAADIVMSEFYKLVMVFEK